MKKDIPYQFLALLFVFGTMLLQAQYPGSPATKERIGLFTDRNLYVSGEQILFTACLYDPEHPEVIPAGKVLYGELITPDGYRVTQGKYPLVDGKAKGCMVIPTETITGTFYLKAYTKSMRNQGPSTYHFTQVVIIHPDKKEVLPARNEETAGFPDLASGGAQTLAGIAVVTDKISYAKREQVKVGFEFSPADSTSPHLLCLTVAPALSIRSINPIIPGVDESGPDDHFSPETKGISLTGRLLDKNSMLPIAGRKVNLSVIGDKDFMAARTDDSGRFFFNLADHQGSRDIFLCTENIPDAIPSLLIDNDFCPVSVSLPSPEFHLSEEEKQAVLSLAVNYRVSSAFNMDTTEESGSGPDPVMSFYGQPDEIIVPDKYIELPTLEEYFNELPSIVKVRKSQGVKHFRFIPVKADMVIYEPLVLIDWVAVDDIDNILALSPSGIARIELINAPYIKGDMVYGGIISFISKANDFGGIDLPGSGTFINFTFYHDCEGAIPEVPSRSNLPDGRNTLYWNPNIELNPDGSPEMNFLTPDTPGKYIVLLRGVTNTGFEFRAQTIIEVF